MDMNTIIVLGAALACAFSAYVLWKSKQDGLSFIDEVKRQLDGHKSETVKATVAAVQAIQATPVAPAPVAPAVEAPVRPEPPFASVGAAIVKIQDMQYEAELLMDHSRPKPVYDGAPMTVKGPTPVRDEMVTGPMISQFIADHHSGLASKFTRVNKWYCKYPTCDAEDACDAILHDRDLSGADLANAIGQQHRDDAAHVDGDLYNGPYPVGSLSQADVFYLLRIKPAYAERTGRNVIIDVVYGSAEKVNELIQDAAEVHAPEMEAFNMDAYQGPLRPIVESRMNGR